jgi:hypothetical protein
MQFIRSKNMTASVEVLQNRIKIECLDELCQSIGTIVSVEGDTGLIHCVWGEHEVVRELHKTGVKFSLPRCPNSFCWSIIYDEAAGKIVIESSTKNDELDPDFSESIEVFMDEWLEGLSILETED